MHNKCPLNVEPSKLIWKYISFTLIAILDSYSTRPHVIDLIFIPELQIIIIHRHKTKLNVKNKNSNFFPWNAKSGWCGGIFRIDVKTKHVYVFLLGILLQPTTKKKRLTRLTEPSNLHVSFYKTMRFEGRTESGSNSSVSSVNLLWEREKKHKQKFILLFHGRRRKRWKKCVVQIRCSAWWAPQFIIMLHSV